MKIIETSGVLPVNKSGIQKGYIEDIGGGLYCFTSGSYKQILKQSEYDALIEAAKNNPKAEASKAQDNPKAEASKAQDNPKAEASEAQDNPKKK